MKLRLTLRAVGDLHGIARYLTARNPAAAQRVETAIRATLETVADYPLIGRRQADASVRKAVTPEFGYLIYYEVNDALEEIAVLTIQHCRQERPYEDA